MWRYVALLIVVITNYNYSVVNCESQEYWNELGKSAIEEALESHRQFNYGIAKNVIIFIGDGMGPTTVTSARIYGKSEKGHLVFEKFPNVGALKTYSNNKLVPDSASTASALFSGVKINHKTSGVDETVERNDCTASLNPDAQLETILDWAEKAGKSTGFVTTTRVTHATPSGLYAHCADRNWECEDTIPEESRECKDIARQLIEDNPNINVIMGGGRQCLQSNVEGTIDDPIDTWACFSKDGRDLIKDWKDEKQERGVNYTVVGNNEELADVDEDTDYLLGIFANGHLKMDFERDRGPEGMPSLTNMTEKAIQVLRRNKNGFVLMVEGGLIDFAHHRGKARKALDETVAFNTAIERALVLMDDLIDDTLFVVTSDHAHSDIFTGYPDRNQSILSVAQQSKYENNSYTALLYGTGGPDNYQFTVKDGKVARVDPSTQDTEDFEYSQQSGVLTDEVAHSGTDVLVYAKGPMGHLFHSVHEQTHVAYVVSYAAKLGQFVNRPNHNIASVLTPNNVLLTVILYIVNN